MSTRVLALPLGARDTGELEEVPIPPEWHSLDLGSFLERIADWGHRTDAAKRFKNIIVIPGIEEHEVLNNIGKHLVKTTPHGDIDPIALKFAMHTIAASFNKRHGRYSSIAPNAYVGTFYAPKNLHQVCWVLATHLLFSMDELNQQTSPMIMPEPIVSPEMQG